MKKFKILKQKSDCVLLSKEHDDVLCFYVKDIENETIYMGYDSVRAEDVYNNYDLERIREERKTIFENWLKENAEA